MCNVTMNPIGEVEWDIGPCGFIICILYILIYIHIIYRLYSIQQHSH